jgi:solute carrier family 45, member 1/2/4
MQGIGNIVGMFCGGVGLPQAFPWLGNSQFKVLCALASISIIVTATVSCAAVSERDPSHDVESTDSEGLIAIFKSLWKSLFRLPTQVAQVCKIQFLAWMGWFPFLFYTSTYVGEIYVEPYFTANPNMTKEDIDELWEAGTKKGSVALLAFAIVTFVSSVILPFLVAPTYKTPLSASLESSTSSHMAQPELMTSTPTPSVHHLRRTSSASRPPRALRALKKARAVLASVTSNLYVPGLTLRRTWIGSHVLFFLCMWATLFVKSIGMATVLVGAVGVPWAITMWAPFALIADEVSKREALRRKGLRPGHITAGAAAAAGLPDDVAALVAQEDANEPDDVADQAGVVLGIHNCSVSAPQVVMTLAGSILFKWMQKPRGTPGDNSVAWFFRLGGICALAAGYVATRMHEEPGSDRGITYSRARMDEENGSRR